ncbi:MAG: competence/damage-inducible protein A [Panacagrimonas sp.]
MKVGLFVIGDEILSGKRQDRHLSKVIALLGARGMALDWARFVGDDIEDISNAIRQSLARDDLVLSCGGIGATPDDLTRQAAAKAFDLPLARHREAEALIESEYGDRAHPHRVLMADFPQGAGLIPNPVNRVAGFFVGHHHFVPGFPDMAWPMIEWVLDQRYPALHSKEPPVEFSLRVLGSAAESDLLELMEDVLARFPAIRLSSLPFRGDGERPRHIELGIRGPETLAAEAFAYLHAQLRQREGLALELLRAPKT